MEFLKNLFSGNKKDVSLQDIDFGHFTTVVARGNDIVWKGQVEFLNENGSLFISGDYSQLDLLQKTLLQELLKNETSIEVEINEALSLQFKEAGKQYSKWTDHFNFSSISTLNKEVSITFEEKETLYHFNIYFSNGKQIGVSIDG